MLAQARKLYEENKFRDAIDIADKIYNLDATWLDNLLILASAHMQLSNISEAIFYNQQAIRVDPNFGEAYSNLGNALKELGDVEGAIQAYSKSIKLKPKFADAYNNLACSYAQLGRIDQAIETYRMALVIDPSLADAHSNLGNMLKVKGKFTEAKKAYLEAIRLRPDFAIAWSNLGGIFKEENDLKTSVAYYKEALRLMPEFADAYSNLGGVLKESGMIEEAKKAFREAIRLRPDFAVAHGNLGNCLFEEGDLDGAMRSYRHALQLEPNYPDAYNNLGNAHREKGELDEAVACYRTTLRLKIDHPHAYNNLGNTLKDKGLVKEAMHCYATACRLMSRFPEAQNNLGSLLKEQGKRRVALAHYKEAIAADPKFAEAYCNMGSCHKDLHEIEEAIKCFTTAINIRPDFADAYYCLGGCFHGASRIRDAILCYEKALELRPEFPSAFARLHDARLRVADWTSRQESEERLREILLKQLHIDSHSLPCIEPFNAIVQGVSPEQALPLAAKHAKFGVRSSIAIVEGHRFRFRAKKPSARLRVGYVSSDFGNHPVGRALLHTLKAHDRSAIEVFCYALRPDDMSKWRREYEQAVEHFVDVSSDTALNVARRIHGDCVNVLINLNGFTEGAMNEVFALRPAPVQAQYLGYPGTMGADFIDYVVGDEVVCPLTNADHFSEKIIHVSTPYLVTDHKHSFASLHESPGGTSGKEETKSTGEHGSKMPAQTRLTRGDVGLADDRFVFCCFAQHQKICPDVFTAWCRVLSTCPNTTLWLLAWTKEGKENLYKEAERRKISRDRIVFSDVLPRAEHMKRCHLADVYVDTLKFNSVNTICDMLWSGTPAITVLGKSMASRTAASALRSLDLDDCVLDSLATYEEKIVQLAGDMNAAFRMRKGIRTRVRSSALFDTKASAKKLEKAYRLMWRKHEWGKSPSHVTSHSGASKAEKI